MSIIIISIQSKLRAENSRVYVQIPVRMFCKNFQIAKSFPFEAFSGTHRQTNIQTNKQTEGQTLRPIYIIFTPTTKDPKHKYIT